MVNAIHWIVLLVFLIPICWIQIYLVNSSLSNGACLVKCVVFQHPISTTFSLHLFFFFQKYLEEESSLVEGVVGFHDAIRKCKSSWPSTNIHPYGVMAMEPCYLIYHQTVLLSSEPCAMSNKMNLCKLMVKRTRDWLPPSFLAALLLAPHMCSWSPWLKRKIWDCSQSITKYLNFFSFFFQFSGQCFICTCSLIESLSLHVHSLVSCMCFILYRC